MAKVQIMRYASSTAPYTCTAMEVGTRVEGMCLWKLSVAEPEATMHHVSTHKRMQACTNTCKYAQACTNACKHVRTHASMHKRMHMHKRTHTYRAKFGMYATRYS